MISSAQIDQIRDALRQSIRDHYLADEAENVRRLVREANIDMDLRQRASQRAADLVRTIRTSTNPTMMENFLAEYGLSTREGIALMCLAEALLRVPDSETIDALISDKIAPSQWGQHLGQSASSLINASTWALMLTGKVLQGGDEAEEGLISTLHGMVRRLGEPVVRTAVSQAMRELGRQFVLGRNIDEAIKRAAELETEGYTYSYDMLGEAARTEEDARRYHLSYSEAIAAIASNCKSDDIRKNPGISVKLSALHPRYEMGKKERVMTELVARTESLALLARSANMGFNIDAEEMDRLDLSLDVIEKLFSNPALAGWDGFGVVVQSYGHRASFVIDWLYNLSIKFDRKIMVRLVKGAYWDAEIKRAQVFGLDGFPVFTRKVNSDISYLSIADKLLGMTDRIYPQFATHNANSVASVQELADHHGVEKAQFEFQRLHGMGESLMDTVMKKDKVNCRIYAPVGAHEDLLAYLVRRLLENGANSSFVNQIVDETISPEEVAKDPFAQLEELGDAIVNPYITKPCDLFGAKRRNAKGWDITDPMEIAALDGARNAYRNHIWQAEPLLAAPFSADKKQPSFNPADSSDQVGMVIEACSDDVEVALSHARKGYDEWSVVPVAERAAIIKKAADLYEQNAPELFALTSREAGKIMMDAVGEVREAVDFARFYACEAERLNSRHEQKARGVIACISPWNFPLAIFSGQVFAALAAGNAVIAKPAGQTPLIAHRAVQMMHEAGVPRAALQLLPGDGPTIGAPLTHDSRINGVCFTGSTATAQRINRAMAEKIDPSAPLIAETGGLNAMIIDSTALPEQAVRDILASSFQSAGQRCSALRMLYVQADIKDKLLDMLKGAMDELTLDNPWDWATDIGPVIDVDAQAKINAHIEKHEAKGNLIKRLDVPAKGLFCPPSLIELSGIEALEEEIFGPVLHVASFEAKDIDNVVKAINDKGFGLTFGLHTRMDNRVQDIVDAVKVGNIYVNRNQIGAIVGSQPFGGEGLSGTGPKAGGPHYVARFLKTDAEPVKNTQDEASSAQHHDYMPAVEIQYAIHRLAAERERCLHWANNDYRYAALRSVFDLPLHLDEAMSFEMDSIELPGPTGESNRLSFHPRGVILATGPDKETATIQTVAALVAGNPVVIVSEGAKELAEAFAKADAPVIGLDGIIAPENLEDLEGIEAVASNDDEQTLRTMRKALALRSGALLPLITEGAAPSRYILERHLCVDTTAAGGNATLLAAAEGSQAE